MRGHVGNINKEVTLLSKQLTVLDALMVNNLIGTVVVEGLSSPLN